MKLKAYKLQFKDAIERSTVLDEFRRQGAPALVLDTCQRAEIYSFSDPELDGHYVAGEWQAEEAFERLARIAAGLDSRILGELEVLGQVRTSYKQFAETYGPAERKLDRVFQDAIALGRKARKMSGIDQKMTSLSGLASSRLLQAIPTGAPLAVIGTGSLAGSVARYLRKRGESPIRIMGRCPEKAMSLAMKVDGFGIGLDDLAEGLKGVAGIITATAAPHPVVYARHLEASLKPLHIIDLGEPADCDVEVLSMDHVQYTGLLEVEGKAQLNSAHRRECAAVAEQIVKNGIREWLERRNRAAQYAKC